MIILKLFFLFSGGLAAEGNRAPAFESLKSPNAFPLDCHFRSSHLRGRFRLSALGEPQLLLINPATQAKHECRLRVDFLSFGTADILAKVRVRFRPLEDCAPVLAPEFQRLVELNPELEITGSELRLWIERLEKAPACEILKFDREGLARVVTKFEKSTGTGQGAGKAIRNLRIPR